MTLPRLTAATLAKALPAGTLPGVRRPAYDRRRLQAGIVHLGLGAFARAHGALYTEDVLDTGLVPWGIVGVSLKRPDQRDRLAPQDGLYTALQRDGAGSSARIVGSVLGVRVLPEDHEAVLSVMTEPGIRIISLTITEKGYCHDPATGLLDETHPDIVHDLENPDTPRTAIGLIAEALERRRSAGTPPFTVLCCDNLPHNGALVARLVQDFSALRDCGLSAWIEAHGAFPSTMVDRIVPATTELDIDAVAAATGLHDAAPVVHEPFRQWVIEDRFVDGMRPAWERVGAELVTDVAAHETMKLRLLNGAHSALAYLGLLSGRETIAEAVADPALRGYVEAMWREEIIPVVPAPHGVDLAGYTTSLMGRFANTAIRHRTWQIAMDGSQKLPQRIVATIRDRLRVGLPFPRLALAVAAWIRCLGGMDEAGRAIDIRDPLADALRRRLEAAGPDPARQAAAILAVEAVFGSDLPRHPRVVEALTAALVLLSTRGARAGAASLAD